MSRRDVFLLRVAALWTVMVWAVFLRNLFFRDNTHGFGFKAVHTVLAVVSLGFAAAIWAVAAHRGPRPGERTGAR
jgi:hypothetical protein